MKPEVSIIVPVYNVERYIERCVNSICSQSFSNIEIILIDDGSTDESGNLCDLLSLKDNRIKVIHQKNRGLSAARNTGLACVNGSWVCFIDSDDWVEKNFLENLINEAGINQCDIVGCAYRKTDGRLQITSNEKYSLSVYENENIMSFLIDNRIQQVVWNKLYKKSVIAGILFEEGKYHEDEFWSYQVFAKVNKYVEIDYVGYNYFQRSDSIMGEDYSLKRLHAIEAKVQRQKYLEKNMPTISEKGKVNLLFACFYHGQLALQQLNKNEQKIVFRELENVVKDYRMNLEELSILPFSHKLWMVFARISLVFTCKVRNLCKIGW